MRDSDFPLGLAEAASGSDHLGLWARGGAMRIQVMYIIHIVMYVVHIDSIRFLA